MTEDQELRIQEELEYLDNPVTYDLSSPEDVLFKVTRPGSSTNSSEDWTGYIIEFCTVINHVNEKVYGAASHMIFDIGLFEYTIQELVDMPGEGWFVLEGVTAELIPGRGWQYGAEMEFNFIKLRPATPEELMIT